MVKKVLLYLFLCLCLTAATYSEDVTLGRMKLTLHEGIGRFSPYYLTEIRAEEYLPLFVAEDPRTSYISVSLDNRVYRLGDSGLFSLDTDISSDRAVFTWKSSEITVRQEFRFITSPNASLADGIKMDITLTNISEKAVSAGVRLLIDTYLGEDSNLHFITKETSGISGEKTVVPSADQTFWISKENRQAKTGLRWEIYGTGITSPDKVIFANWKRLTETPWEYETNTGRNFNLLPYSINDSAAAVYYNPSRLETGKSRTISIVFGNAADEGFALADNADSDVFNNLAAQETSETDEFTLQGDLIALNDLIARINDLLESDAEITQDQIEVLTRALSRLEQRKPNYE
ncbi:MAG: hypothetical protein ACLFST_14995 [Spirochaetia bacterium]